MIIGESPGREELKNGIPFVGMSWRIVNHLLKYTGLDEVEPYVTNALHCWPGSNKSDATMTTAVQQCSHQLIDEINLAPRKLVLTLGAPALRAVTKNFGLKITQERGRVITDELHESIKGVEHAFSTIHPAFILRGGGNFRQFREDIMYASRIWRSGDAIKQNPDVDYIVLDTPQLLLKLLNYLREEVKKSPTPIDVGADIETGSKPEDPEGPGGFNHIDDAVLMLGLAIKEDAVYIIPEEMLGHPIVRKIFQLKGLLWGWHNGKFDVKFLRRAGIEEARVDEDTMLMSYTLDERGGVHSLDQVAHDWLGVPNWKGMLDKYKKKKQSYRVIPKEVLYKYAAYDISSTLRLVKFLRPLIMRDENNKKLYYRTLLPASEYLSRVEDRGLLVDFERVRENEVKLDKQAMDLAEPIFEEALKYPNSDYTEKLCNSPKQLAQLLYVDIGLESKDKGTGNDVLEKLPQHPVVVALRKYRKVAKLNGTYVKPLHTGVASDNKIHTTFKIHATATGRLASSDPMNVQNIPRDAEIRGQFVARPGYIYIEPDLSQAEMRSLAEFSGDPLLCKIYNDPNMPGVHDTMRSRMYGDPENWDAGQVRYYQEKFFVREEDPKKQLKAILDEQKMRAKNVNFGIIYGITKYGLADQMECTHAEAQQALNVWAQTFPVAWAFIQQCMQAPIKGQNLVTVFGNRKRHGVISQENLRNLQTEAANFIHQATASHIMLHAGIRNDRFLEREYGAEIVNTVHDSMLIETPNIPEVVVKVTDLICADLELIPKLWGLHRVPFEADAKMGPRWGRAYMDGYKTYKEKFLVAA
jgi:uracil-DNA glycosylase family 4